MRDLMGLMGKAKEMQKKMEEMQAEIAAMSVSATSGGGLVSVRVNGRGQLEEVKIDPSLMKEDEVEIVEDLIIAAHNDAKSKIEVMMQEKTRELTAGLPIPPGMKLPF